MSLPLALASLNKRWPLVGVFAGRLGWGGTLLGLALSSALRRPSTAKLAVVILLFTARKLLRKLVVAQPALKPGRMRRRS
jgi:hypothetical protein